MADPKKKLVKRVVKTDNLHASFLKKTQLEESLTGRVVRKIRGLF